MQCKDIEDVNPDKDPKDKTRYLESEIEGIQRPVRKSRRKRPGRTEGEGRRNSVAGEDKIVLCKRKRQGASKVAEVPKV